MNITRENYEAFFLDFHEGNLSESLKAELQDFLVENPDLRQELDSFELVMLENGNRMEMPGKSSLKKVAGEESLKELPDYLLIAHFEGDLTDIQSLELLARVESDKALKRDFDLYGKTRLLPESGILFPRKSSLKHFRIGLNPVILRQLAVAAAVIAFLVSIFIYLPQMNKGPEIAELKPDPNITNEDFSTIVLPDTDSSVPQNIDPRKPSQNIIPPVNIRKQESENKTPSPVITPAPRVTRTNAIAFLESIRIENLNFSTPRPAQIELKHDFLGFSFSSLYSDEALALLDDDEPEQEPVISLPGRVTNFVNLAYGSIEQTTTNYVQNIEKRVSERNIGFWDIAGYGLAGVAQLTGTSLTIDKARDENGRITTFGIGNIRFKDSTRNP